MVICCMVDINGSNNLGKTTVVTGNFVVVQLHEFELSQGNLLSMLEERALVLRFPGQRRRYCQSSFR